MLLLLLSALQLAGGTSPPAPGDSARVFHGRLSQLEVQAPRREAQISVDGVLDEPVWQEAARLTGFSQYRPVDGRPAEDSTEVLVWYSPHAIHFGIRAFEPHAPPNAPLADRDKIDAGDHVQILLDTFDDGRRAFLLGVNPLGIQADGTRSEGAQASRRLGEVADQSGVDLSPDFLFQSKGRLTDYGYEIEVMVPLKSLRYQAAERQDWGINVVRVVQHSGHELTWAPVRQGAASFLAQGGKLRGLASLRRGLVLDVNPVATTRVTGLRGPEGWDYGAGDPELGGNLRWGVTSNLTLNGTYNPDFSQVEADVQQVAYDPRSAVFFPEKRPFFLEGSEHFDTPSRLIYTRRIVSPVGAAKVAGKIAGTDVGALFAVDDAALSEGGSHPVYGLVRMRRDLGEQSTAGLVYTDRSDGGDFNRVVGADARLVFRELYSVSAQLARSATRTDRGTRFAPLFNLGLERRGRSFGLAATVSGISPDFVAASGFIRRAGVAQANVRPQFTRFGRPGALLESYTASVLLDGTWLYDRFMEGGGAQDLKLHLGNNFALRGGWRTSATFLLESFGYPADLYVDYWVERRTAQGTDTVPFTGGERIPNFDVVLNLATPSFPRFSGNVSLILGRDENFQEWAPAYVGFATVDAEWRPTEKLRINGRLDRQQYLRYGDRSTVASRSIPRLRLEYQASRAIFFRFVGQYDARFQDDLRDESRTNDPILIRDPRTGAFAPAERFTRNDFRADWLFSYQPSPGTVVFAGYGSSMTEPASFRFRDLSRTSDGLFFKVSYLFRM